MGVYRSGMALSLISEWLGHNDPETTLIYARADTEMKRKTIEKAEAAAEKRIRRLNSNASFFGFFVI